MFFANNNLIQLLQNNLQQKEQEIMNLKMKINDSPKKEIFSRDQMRTVHFISTDQTLQCSIPCIGTDIFAEVEERLYKQYPEHREHNNYFLANGKQVLRFKTIDQNNIGEGKPVTMNIGN